MHAPPEVPGVHHREVAAAGTRWHVAEAGTGTGEPVVLLHGWPQHGWMWRELVPGLAPHARLVMPDLPGFGWSATPPWDYAKERLADAVLALLDVLGHARFSLVGHDWGGFIAWLIALRAPERVEHIATLNIIHPWIGAQRPTPASLARIAYQPVLAAPGLGPAIMPRIVPLVLRRGAHRHTWTEEEIEAYVAPYRDRARAAAASALYRTFLTKEVGPLVKGRYRDRRYDGPALLLTGEHDPVISPDRLEGTGTNAGDARTGTIPACGHFSAEERPDAVLARLVPFLFGDSS